MAWVLTKGLTTWRNEINTAFPDRDKASDGAIGDVAHAQGTSGHNNENSGHAEFNDRDGIDEVRAIDVDKDLRNPKFTMEMLIQWLVTKARNGDYIPFRYFIYNKRIWSRSTGWKTQAYNGFNPHDHHAHFSGDYTQKADNWEGSLGLAAYVAKMTGITVEDNMASVWDEDTIQNPSWRSDAPKNPYVTAKFALYDTWQKSHDASIKVDALSGVVKAGIAAEASRDAQEAARDAALSGTLQQMLALLKAGGNQVITMSPAQFAELKEAVLQKIAEAGQDAADATNAKLNQIADALDNAGEALSSVGEVTAQK